MKIIKYSLGIDMASKSMQCCLSSIDARHTGSYSIRCKDSGKRGPALLHKGCGSVEHSRAKKLLVILYTLWKKDQAFSQQQTVAEESHQI